MTTREEHQRRLITRLRRVEGQIRGVQGMIGNGAACEDIAQQLAAARRALDRSCHDASIRTLAEALTAPVSTLAPDPRCAGAARYVRNILGLCARLGVGTRRTARNMLVHDKGRHGMDMTAG